MHLEEQRGASSGPGERCAWSGSAERDRQVHELVHVHLVALVTLAIADEAPGAYFFNAAMRRSSAL